jgi:hypothetical protein
MREQLTIRVELVDGVATRREVPRADFGYAKNGEEKRQQALCEELRRIELVEICPAKGARLERVSQAPRRGRLVR